MKRAVLIALAGLTLGACSPPMDANERGGVIVTAPAWSAAFVNATVEEHCAKYGRRPKVPPDAQPFNIHAGHQQYRFECVPR
jgi:hypothetical protein